MRMLVLFCLALGISLPFAASAQVSEADLVTARATVARYVIAQTTRMVADTNNINAPVRVRSAFMVVDPVKKKLDIVQYLDGYPECPATAELSLKGGVLVDLSKETLTSCPRVKATEIQLHIVGNLVTAARQIKQKGYPESRSNGS